MTPARAAGSLEGVIARRAALLLLCFGFASARAEPGRHLNYAESTDRKVYAFVFGSRDRCRVFKRSAAPSEPFKRMRRGRYGAVHQGEPGTQKIADFRLRMRPVHILPTNDAKYLLTFANRAMDGGTPTEDAVWVLDEPGRFERLDYSKLPNETLPEWPDLKRKLGKTKKRPPGAVMRGAAYAFLTREIAPGRILVGRQTEEGGDWIAEPVCYEVRTESFGVVSPEPRDLRRLLRDSEPLFRAAAARRLGQLAQKENEKALRDALQKETNVLARAEMAWALVRGGDRSSRKTLRGLLRSPKNPPARRAAASALARVSPSGADADALARALEQEDPATVRLASIALARMGQPAVAPVVRAASSSRPEVRIAALSTLAFIDDPKAEKVVLQKLRDRNADVQSAAAVALTSPPRALFPANYGEFARGLTACGRAKNPNATRRLCILAAHAQMLHDAVLEALVGLTPQEPKAIWALQRLVEKDLTTADEWRAWWKTEKAKK